MQAARTLLFQDLSDAAHHVINMKWIGDEGVVAEKSDGADLSIGREAGQANYRDIVQRALGVNLSRNFVDLKVLWFSVNQDQVRPKLECRFQSLGAVACFSDQIFSAGSKRRADHGRQARLVVDQKNALSRVHATNEFVLTLL